MWLVNTDCAEQQIICDTCSFSQWHSFISNSTVTVGDDISLEQIQQGWAILKTLCIVADTEWLTFPWQGISCNNADNDSSVFVVKATQLSFIILWHTCSHPDALQPFVAEAHQQQVGEKKDVNIPSRINSFFIFISLSSYVTNTGRDTMFVKQLVVVQYLFSCRFTFHTDWSVLDLNRQHSSSQVWASDAKLEMVFI